MVLDIVAPAVPGETHLEVCLHVGDQGLQGIGELLAERDVALVPRQEQIKITTMLDDISCWLT